jgi:hypothetical protein
MCSRNISMSRFCSRNFRETNQNPIDTMPHQPIQNVVEIKSLGLEVGYTNASEHILATKIPKTIKTTAERRAQSASSPALFIFASSSTRRSAGVGGTSSARRAGAAAIRRAMPAIIHIGTRSGGRVSPGLSKISGAGHSSASLIVNARLQKGHGIVKQGALLQM